MEYRAVIIIPDFPSITPGDDRGFELLAWLDERTDMGPVMSGPGPGGEPAALTLATDAPDQATAVARMMTAAGAALRSIGLGQLYPVELESVSLSER